MTISTGSRLHRDAGVEALDGQQRQSDREGGGDDHHEADLQRHRRRERARRRADGPQQGERLAASAPSGSGRRSR